MLARLGGDEFAILLDRVTESDAQRMAARVRAGLQAPVQLGAATVVIDGSVGIALAPQHAGTPEELLQVADLAMYAAKGQRRGVLVYDEARDGMGRRRLELVAELRQGIGDGQLLLHYQPQLDLRTGRVVAVEALVRWQHPTRGLLGPHEFIDLAESAGLMGLLTTWVVEDALRQCRQWRDQGLDLRVAVNVSPSAVVDRDFPVRVERLLGQHGLTAERLVLEVTEELLMDNRERTVEALTVMRRMGAGISIDDYGTGYSSLAYLKDLPVTELKLDRSFITSMSSSGRSSAIVRSTLNLAHALGLELVAEGVEDEATLRALTALGCDLAQGYHLSRPVVAGDVADAVQRIVHTPASA
jgi:predicted signal transduction protein with EAL and GGDEF domain